jgi:hypothetical protein
VLLIDLSGDHKNESINDSLTTHLITFGVSFMAVGHAKNMEKNDVTRSKTTDGK